MTRSYFVEDVDTWGELIYLCNDKGYYDCDNIYHKDDFCYYINDEIISKARTSNWNEIREWLNSLPDDDGEYYRRDECDDWYVCDDDDFESLKADFLEWMDENDFWDDSEEEEIRTDDPQDDMDLCGELDDQDEISIGELFVACSNELKSVEKDKNNKRKDQESDAEFAA